MKSCSRKILELFYNAKHSGRIMRPDAVGRVGEDDDGLVIELTWRIVDEIIVEAKFRAFGNPNAIAITSLMTDNIIGKNVEEAMQIDESVITDNLDEFRPEYIEAYDMVHAAMVEAYNNYLKRKNYKTDNVQVKHVKVEHELTEEEREAGLLHKIEGEVAMVKVVETERRGRGRPRKPVDESQVVELGEKRGRGRPRKIVDESELVEVGEKRGRGRPRKIVDESEIVITEKRGRGRPRKPIDENAIIGVGEKRGRGRPRKERPEGEMEIIGEKRGRGRPRKIVDESAIVEVGEKRGRGRPRKIVDETLIVEVGEKRGRGRPRKPVDENAVVAVGEKRGRGRPRKEGLTLNKIEITENNQVIEENKVETTYNNTITKLNIPNDFDNVSEDETIDSLVGATSEVAKSDDFVSNLISNKLIDEDDETFDADYDLFKSNIRNIFSGKETNSSSYGTSRATAKQIVAAEQSTKLEEKVENIITSQDETRTESNTQFDVDTQTEVAEEKRGRGRPRKIVDETEVMGDGEKRGRGRPRKIVDEQSEIEHEKRGRGRPRNNPVSSLTRSLNTPGGVPLRNNTQDIVFASKNVTTTNININVTKTTTTNEDSESVSDFAKNVNITSVQQNSTLSTPVSPIKEKEEISYDDEIEIEPVQQSGIAFKDFDDDDFDDEYDDEIEEMESEDADIKDEAPKGGIEDLLKALLGD